MTVASHVTDATVIHRNA